MLTNNLVATPVADVAMSADNGCLDCKHPHAMCDCGRGPVTCEYDLCQVCIEERQCFVIALAAAIDDPHFRVVNAQVMHRTGGYIVWRLMSNTGAGWLMAHLRNTQTLGYNNYFTSLGAATAKAEWLAGKRTAPPGA